MKTNLAAPSLRRLKAHRQAGHALLMALAIVTIISGMVGVAMQRSTYATRTSARASNFAAAERAADGALEYAYGTWKTAISQKDYPLNKNVDNAVLVPTGPTILGFSYTSPITIDPVDAYGSPVSVPVPSSTQLTSYPGWHGNTHSYIATVRLQSTNGPASNQPAAAGVKRIFQYIQVPLFQSMYFYENNLEIYRPAPMIVSGLVHTNSRLLISGQADNSIIDLQFTGNLSYAGGNATTPGYSNTEVPVGGAAWAGFSAATAAANMEDPTFSAGGESQQVSSVERYEPLGKSPSLVINTTDTNPNNDSMREIIEPPNLSYTDPPEISKRRAYNKAGIVFEINGTTVNITTKNGTTLSSTTINNLKTAFTGKSTVYDQREGKNVDVSKINVSKITTELNAVSSGFNGLLYIHDITTVTTSDPEPKTIRLENGGVLPNNGLTIASQNPVYIKGDYNTGTTTTPTNVPANSTGNPNNTDSPVVSGYTRKPAAVLADAVMFLSNSWNDANASSSVSSRPASNTTYNLGIMAGNIPSGWDPDGSGSAAAYGYSGGANNFPRFLEAWSGKACTYYGSMVQLYQSKIFTGKWDTGNIYSAPNRRWNFDTMFSTTPPPGSLDAVAIIRGGYTKL